MEKKQMHGMLKFHEKAEKALREHGRIKDADAALKHIKKLKIQIEKDGGK